MMRGSGKAPDFPDKANDDTNKPHTTSSAPSWLRLKDPRIVRVSRAFGGKDRHSKVCTVRGLRDRRVRLSVPTAIQLYDLQDRLGLSQPSKVVDWLLNAAKDDIDELPPLQMPPLSFIARNHAPPRILPSGSSSRGLKIGEEDGNWEETRPSFWNPEGHNWKGKSKEESSSSHHHAPYASSVGSQWEVNSGNFPLSHLGSVSHDVHQNMSLPHQILVCPSGPTTQAYFPAAANLSSNSVEVDHARQEMSQFQMLMMMSAGAGAGASSHNLLPNSHHHHHHLYSLGQSARPFHLGAHVTAPPRPPDHYCQDDDGSEQNKEN